MGCFSFKCKKCGKGIKSNSFNGENVRLSLLVNGKIIEEMQGKYDSYGRVFNGVWVNNPEGSKLKRRQMSFEWESMPWSDIVDLMYGENEESGMVATHVACNPSPNPKKRSKDDPNQGWGRMDEKHRGECEVYHKIIN